MSCLDDSNDNLRWLAPTDLNLDYMGITHLDCVTRVSSGSERKRKEAISESTVKRQRIGITLKLEITDVL